MVANLEMNWKNNHYQDNIFPEKKLKNLKIDLTDKSVIDLGCNIGRMYDYCIKRNAILYIGIDSDEKYIKEAIKRYSSENFILKDLTTIDTLKADVIFALGILHHLTDKQLSELNLKCETLIIEAPIGDDMRKEYNVRTIENYQSLLPEFKLKKVLDSGFITPPVKRKILIFEK